MNMFSDSLIVDLYVRECIQFSTSGSFRIYIPMYIVSMHIIIASSSVRGDVRDPATRRTISQMDKLELEDRHLRLMEENLVRITHTCLAVLRTYDFS